MHIGELNAPPKKKKKRVGRGPGSGSGKTSGRGQKGYGSRSGNKKRPWFEGGQMPLQRRVPKRGFFSRNRTSYQLVKIAVLDTFEEGATVNPDTLKEKGLIKKTDSPVKILGDGTLSRKLTVYADAFSKSAQEKITGAGGQALTRETREPAAAETA